MLNFPQLILQKGLIIVEPPKEKDYEDFDGTPPEDYDMFDDGSDTFDPTNAPIDGTMDHKWRALGYDHGMYYYYSFLTGQLVPLKPSQHDESNLLQFADIGWWDTNFPSGKKPDYASAKAFMMNACHRVGVFDDQKIRGCGSWLDDGKIVNHRGDHISSEGMDTRIEDYKGKYIYEKDIAVSGCNVCATSK